MKKWPRRTLLGVALASLTIALVAGIIVGLNRLQNGATNNAKIVATNFVGYDLARAITGDASEVKMLMRPGADIHSYEPTPQDIRDIVNADLIIYNGGESDAFIEKLLTDNGVPDKKVLRLMDQVTPVIEEVGPGMEDDPTESNKEEYDEHIWTSPVNMLALVEATRDKLAEIYPDRAKQFASNATQYTNQLLEIDTAFREAVAGGTRRELVFGDRFPFRYFTDEYGLGYFALFPGCAEQTEASAKTMAAIINKVRTDSVPVILKTELSSGALAQTIAEATGARVLELHSAHNISTTDFETGVTYLDLARRNLAVIREALK